MAAAQRRPVAGAELRCYYYASRPALTDLLPSLASSAKQLTQLCGRLSMAGFTSASEVQRAGGALADLTSLRHLQLSVEGAEARGGAAPLLRSLQGLTRLQHCDLCLVGSGPGFMHLGSAGLQHLPASLTSLGLLVRPGLHNDNTEMFISEAGIGEILATEEDGLDSDFAFSRYPSTPQPPMNLGHLRALKELRPAGAAQAWPIVGDLLQLNIRAGDVLPPNLTRLELHADHRDLGGLLTGPLSAPTVAPLMALTRLEFLRVFSCKAPAGQLRQLAAALAPPRGALKAATLYYRSPAAAAAAAPAWPLLPIAGLTVSWDAPYGFGCGYDDEDGEEDEEQRCAAVLTAIGKLTGLTSLAMTGAMDATQQQLAAVLTNLTCLQELAVDGVFPSRAGGRTGAATPPASAPTVLAAIARLTALTKLALSGHLDATSHQLAATLAGLTSLRRLALSGSLRDAPDTTAAAAAAAPSAAAVVMSNAIAALPGLVELESYSYPGRFAVSEALIRSNATQLTSL